MLFARSPQLDGPGPGRAGRGALPPGPVPGIGVGGGDHPRPLPRWCSCACRRRCPTPTNSAPGCEVRARSHRGGRRDAPAGRVAQPRGHRREGQPARRARAPVAQRQGSTPRHWRSTSVWRAWPGAPAACGTRGWSARVAASSSRRSTTWPCCPPSSSSSPGPPATTPSPSACRTGCASRRPEERAEIRRRCEEHTEGLPDEELRVLGYGPWAAGLEAGLGSHHAGLIPAFREAVEDCFSSNLLRVVFATETLSLGINMPARTVVIERLTKIREHGRSGLSSGEYAQMTGRAGRRGLDSVGHAVVVWSPQVSMVERGRAGHVAAARSALVVPGHLQPGRQPRAPVPRRPGPLHLGPVLRPVPRQRAITTPCRAASTALSDCSSTSATWTSPPGD